MLQKRFWLPMLLVVALLTLAACGGSVPAAEPAATAEPTAAPTEAPAASSEVTTTTEVTGTTELTETATTTDTAAAPDSGEGCAPAADGAFASVDPNGQAIVWWHQHSGDREEKLLPMIEEFNSTNPCSITVEAQYQGEYDDIRDKVNAGIASGEMPAALIVGYQNDQASFQLNEALADFNTFIDDSHWGLTAEEKADFYPSFFNQSVHPLFDNQRLGFPPNRSMEMLFYNQTWLEELGFSGPPTTPEEFKEMACAASAAYREEYNTEPTDGTGGYVLRDDASAIAAWTFAFGGDVLTEDGSGYVYNGPATVEALTLLKGMYDEGCAYFFTEGRPNPEFANRRAIFMQGSSSGIPFISGDFQTVASEKGTEPDVWGAAAIPHITEEPVQNVYGGDVMITATTPEQQLAAWIFVKWFTSPEVQAQWVVNSNYFPTRASAMQFLGDRIAEIPQLGQALDLLPFSVYEPQLISYQGVRDAVSEAFNEILQGAEIQATLDALNEDANAQQEELMSEVQ